jgi:hypothetical protein
MMTKLRSLLLDLLITGYTYYRVRPTSNKNNVCIEVLNPLNTFVDRHPESPYAKTAQRAVVRKWMTKEQILNMYGNELSREDLEKFEETWEHSLNESSYYIRTMTNDCIPQTDGLRAGEEIIPGYPDGAFTNYNHRLIPVYEVEWIETDKDFVM